MHVKELPTMNYTVNTGKESNFLQQGVSSGKDHNSTKPQSDIQPKIKVEVKLEKGKKQLKWTAAMDTALIDTFIEAYGQNKKQGRVWDESVYTSIQSEVFAITKKEIEKNHIVSRMRTMRNEFNGFVDIVNKSGFGWDKNKQTVDADDQAWVDLLADPKSREKYEGFRDRGPKWPLSHLEIIFGNNYATGSFSFGGLDSIDRSNFDNVPDMQVPQDFIDLDDIQEEVVDKVGEKRKCTSGKRKVGKKEKAVGELAESVQGVASELVNLRKAVDPAKRAEFMRTQIMNVEGFNTHYLRKAYLLLMRDTKGYIKGQKEVNVHATRDVTKQNEVSTSRK